MSLLYVKVTEEHLQRVHIIKVLIIKVSESFDFSKELIVGSINKVGHFFTLHVMPLFLKFPSRVYCFF